MFDLLGFRPNIFPFIFAGVFCSILALQPIHHWSLSQNFDFLSASPYSWIFISISFLDFQSQEISQWLKLLFSTLVLSIYYICQANNTSILLCSTFCEDTKSENFWSFCNFCCFFSARY